MLLLHLRDNCIQIYHLGRDIVGYTVGNLVLRWRAIYIAFRWRVDDDQAFKAGMVAL